MFSVSVEPVDGLLFRVHRGTDGYGSPYVAVCTVVAAGESTAEVKGLVAAGLTLAEFAEMVRTIEGEMRERGFTRYRYERVKRGRSVWYEKEL